MTIRRRTLKDQNDKQRVNEVLAAAVWCSLELQRYFGEFMYFDSDDRELKFCGSCPFDEDDLFMAEKRLEDLKECIKIIREKTEIKE